MAGIYVHIPFCTKLCYYCDFYFSLSLNNVEDVVYCIANELIARKEYLNNLPISTLYFGGGTPTVLPVAQLEKIIQTIKNNYSTLNLEEITVEANPDDLTQEYCHALIAAGFNRISIGIQSFNDVDLILMNRRHTAEEAKNAVRNAQLAGFLNITIDLIYGLPNQTLAAWLQNINKALELNVQHISAYHLTIEPKTRFGNLNKKGELIEMPDEESLEQFKILRKTLLKNGFEHYEISNFCKPGFQSKHNSSYWSGVQYLGVGPSAHSFNGTNRQWNIANNLRYIKAIKDGSPEFMIEELSPNNQINEYLLTSLRMIKGMQMNLFVDKFGNKTLKTVLQNAERWIDSGYLINSGNALYFSENGLFVSDQIISDLMLV